MVHELGRRAARWRGWPFILALALAWLAAAPLSARPQHPLAREILANVDAGAMRDLMEAARTQPDVALVNIMPVNDNKFRYVFIWPASNPMMSEDRVGRSFLDRFLQFAHNQRFLATGFCLTPDGMGLLSASYGDVEVNVAFRNIEVYRDFGWREPCTGKFVTAQEVEKQKAIFDAVKRNPLPLPPPPARDNPSDGLSPFLKGIQVPE